jgi:UbiD family decarboxylase
MARERSKEKRLLNNKNDFRGFLSLLEKENDLIRINKTLSSKFEVAAVVSKLERKQAVLFEKIEDSKILVASNILGTRKRFSLAVGVNDEKSIHSHIVKSIAKASPPRLLSSAAPFYENSSDNLKDLPVITHFEKDAGPFITSSIVFAKDQERENQNSSFVT